MLECVADIRAAPIPDDCFETDILTLLATMHTRFCHPPFGYGLIPELDHAWTLSTAVVADSANNFC